VKRDKKKARQGRSAGGETEERVGKKKRLLVRGVPRELRQPGKIAKRIDWTRQDTPACGGKVTVLQGPGRGPDYPCFRGGSNQNKKRKIH